VARCAVLEGAAMSDWYDAYYDGIADGLTEVEGEIKAAWIITPVKRSDFTSDSDFWREVAIEAVTALRESYAKDQQFMRKHQTGKAAQA
jgi:hypothetical protein